MDSPLSRRMTTDYIKAMKQYYTYMLASQKRGTIYVGVTSDLVKRIWQHKNKVVEGFTEKYDVLMLVYYEVFDDPENAIKREKRFKHWNRRWKIELIEKTNPDWKDLYLEITGDIDGSSGQAGGWQ